MIETGNKYIILKDGYLFFYFTFSFWTENFFFSRVCMTRKQCLSLSLSYTVALCDDKNALFLYMDVQYFILVFLLNKLPRSSAQVWRSPRDHSTKTKSFQSIYLFFFFCKLKWYGVWRVTQEPLITKYFDWIFSKITSYHFKEEREFNNQKFTQHKSVETRRKTKVYLFFLTGSTTEYDKFRNSR